MCATKIARLSGSLLRSIASKFSDRPAVTAVGGETLTYEQLLRQAEKVAHNVQGKRVAIALPFKSVDFVVALCSAWINDSCFLPLNPAHPEELLKYYLEDYRPDIVISTPRKQQTIRELKGRQKFEVVNIEDPKECVVSKGDGSEFLVLYTSGTTGQPKGVLHTQQSIAAQVSAMQEVWNWTPDDCIYQVLPLHHIHGLVNCVITPLATGAHCILHEEGRIDAEILFHRLLKHEPKITLFMAVPTIYTRLVQYYKSKDFSEIEKETIRDSFSRRIRLMVSGSASLPDTIYRGMQEMTGQALVEQYGSTEMGRCLSTRPDQPPDKRPPGVVGQPMPEVTVRLRREDKENVDPASLSDSDVGSDIGELEVKGPGLFSCYLNKPEATKEAFTDDGFFRTGDMATMDPETGNYRIHGRRSIDLIKSGGYKIGALEVERALLRHPNIEECAVLGVPDEEWGERVAAVVYFRPQTRQLGEQEVKDFCSKHIPRYSCPTLVTVIDYPFERNAVGKIDKKRLRKELFGAGKATGQQRPAS